MNKPPFILGIIIMALDRCEVTGEQALESVHLWGRTCPLEGTHQLELGPISAGCSYGTGIAVQG